MYDRFTDKVREMFVLARQRAEQCQNEFINTEHILLAILQIDSCMASIVLKSLGVDFERIGLETEALVVPGPVSVPTSRLHKLPHTPRAKMVVELAIQESIDLQNPYVGTEHFLIALVAEGEGVAAKVLTAAGIRPEYVRRCAAEILEHGAAGESKS